MNYAITTACQDLYLWLDELAFELQAPLLQALMVTDYGPPKPFTYVKYVDSRSVEGYEITELYESLVKYMADHSLNHGIIMTIGGILIFTEDEWIADPLMFKLTTGTDVGKGQAADLSGWIKSNEILTKYFSELIRE